MLVTKIDPLKKPVSNPGLKYEEIRDRRTCTLWSGNLFKGLTADRFLLVGANIDSTATGVNDNDALATLI
jgi:hypothetical protein